MVYRGLKAAAVLTLLALAARWLYRAARRARQERRARRDAAVRAWAAAHGRGYQHEASPLVIVRLKALEVLKASAGEPHSPGNLVDGVYEGLPFVIVDLSGAHPRTLSVKNRDPT